jgi:hypothetical protein
VNGGAKAKTARKTKWLSEGILLPRYDGCESGGLNTTNRLKNLIARDLIGSQIYVLDVKQLRNMANFVEWVSNIIVEIR